MSNRKIINATVNTFDNIEFKSLMERRAYQLYKEAGLSPSYEVSKIVLMDGFKPSIPFYRPINKILKLYSNKVIATTYTPDFIIKGGSYTYYIEIKGFRTDSYSIKVKLFRKWLEEHPNSVFFEVHTIKDVKSSIEIINDYEKNSRINKEVT